MRQSCIKVIWEHSFPDEPVLLYSELDASRYELRKVDLYADGTLHHAGGGESPTGKTDLGLAPTPTVEEINRDPQFLAFEISQREFEAVWSDSLDAPSSVVRDPNG